MTYSEWTICIMRQTGPNKYLFSAFFCLLLIPFFSLAEQTFPAKGIKSLLIKAEHLNLKIKQNQSSDFKIKNPGDLSLKNKEGVLIIQSPSFSSQKSAEGLSSKKPVELEISGPSRPVKLFAFYAKISFSRWTKPVFISSFQGEVKGSNLQGSWEISLKEGLVNMRRLKGSLAVRGFHINQTVSNSQGDFKFYANEGSLRVKKSKGNLSWTTDKAKIHLTQFKGSLKGFSQSGDVRASFQPETVELSTGKASITAFFIGQAPKIRAYTEEGKIYGPRYLYKQFSGKSTKVSGQIRGPLKKGKVSFKSETGNIHIH